MHVLYWWVSMEMERLSSSCVCMTSVPSPPCLFICMRMHLVFPSTEEEKSKREDKARTRWYYRRRKTAE
ncbi:hypothetical protein CSUI_002115 [Cystoisospora suis]|uniref:Uncharacterized protein n=1 Tax=Cystoisospora suis TaxID=483139 RepID=A0A2C6LA06_9APIC|nr:hypothetical protein CSUI_002115 [Cystoisospora suis]